jgi:hypothetical protein
MGRFVFDDGHCEGYVGGCENVIAWGWVRIGHGLVMGGREEKVSVVEGVGGNGTCLDI